MDFAETVITTPRGVFAARTAGPADGPLVLCLHGFPDVASTFDGLLKRLAEAGRRAVAPSCRGYAPSPLDLPPGRDLFRVMAADALAVADALAPGRPFSVVGHDNGAFAAYALLALAGARVQAAVTLSAGHPAAVFRNTGRLPRQWWRSRYAMLFQVPRLSEWWASRDGFAYIGTLWRRWAAPGWTPPEAHLAEVKRVMRASWPAPLLHYRAMPFGGDEAPLSTATLFIAGDQDGCVLPAASTGQERLFAGPFRSEAIPGAGHFPHLEQPGAVEPMILSWLDQHAPAAVMA